MPPDRLGALPDELLHHVLGFLPAHEAVRTSVLARRWRPLWKSVPRLHITYPVKNVDGDYYWDYRRSCDFVNSLFLMRASASLDEVKFDHDVNIKEKTDRWVRHALLCRAQSIIIIGSEDPCGNPWIKLKGPPLVSRYLTKLELNTVDLNDKFLDFTSCPALEALEMTDCFINTQRIVSPSVKLLRINDSYFKGTCISAPSLVCLQISHIMGIAPFLESMPLLETASVKPISWMADYCGEGDQGDYCGSCAACCGEDDHEGRCVPLGGLSNAMNLELTTTPGMLAKITYFLCSKHQGRTVSISLPTIII